MKQKTEWFTVDRDGFAEMHANFPCERMVMELIQNAWDEASTECTVTITELSKGKPAKKLTAVSVVDDNPEGFKNLRDAYTLFGSTSKRSDPTKRGRFNYGEKIVLARAIEATIHTTKGMVIFDKDGRSENTAAKRKSGSEITVYFKRWSDADLIQCLSFLQRLYPPTGTTTTVNGITIPERVCLKEHTATLATEFMKEVDGHRIMSKTRRKTTMRIYPRLSGQAYLYEMGLPVCAIDGPYDVDIQQKIPLSQDRTTVPLSFAQDVYAETLNAMHDQIDLDDMDRGCLKLAMEDERMDVETTKAVFEKMCGTDAVIQSHDPDSDQAAARHSVTLVPSRMFGAAVNCKLREAGVQTSKERFGRDLAVREAEGTMPKDFKLVSVQEDPVKSNFVAYAKMLAMRLCGDPHFTVDLAHWVGSNIEGLNRGNNYIVFNTFNVGASRMSRPVSKCTSLILHELAHCKGAGHDGVYDHEHERLVDSAFALQAREPELFQRFEPQLAGLC